VHYTVEVATDGQQQGLTSARTSDMQLWKAGKQPAAAAAMRSVGPGLAGWYPESQVKQCLGQGLGEDMVLCFLGMSAALTAAAAAAALAASAICWTTPCLTDRALARCTGALCLSSLRASHVSVQEWCRRMWQYAEQLCCASVLRSGCRCCR